MNRMLVLLTSLVVTLMLALFYRRFDSTYARLVIQ